MFKIYPGNPILTGATEHLTDELRFVIDNMPQMVWTTLAGGYHDYYNQRWYEFTGLSFEETKDKGWSLVLHPEDYDRAWGVWQTSLDTGIPYEVEYRMRRFDGTYNWFLARAQPLKDDMGNIIKWFGTCTDIQEQREILEELRKTKEELRISNKNLKSSIEDLGRINLELDNFVYSASHDLKAPLNNLEGLVALLDPTDKGGPDQEEILGLISQSVQRFKVVVDDMTLIAQTAKENNFIQNIDLPLLLSEIKSDIRKLIKSTGTVINQDLQIKHFQYPRKEIRSILFNLISNAIKYRGTNRPLIITVRAKMLKDEILLEVEDNGSGIESEYIPKLFDKYFRINSIVEGSGLGLFLVKRMVENRGGRIGVLSDLGKGSRFSVYLKLQE